MLWMPLENGLKEDVRRALSTRQCTLHPSPGLFIFFHQKAMTWLYFPILYDQSLLWFTFQPMLHESHRPFTAYLNAELPGTLDQERSRSWELVKTEK